MCTPVFLLQANPRGPSAPGCYEWCPQANIYMAQGFMLTLDSLLWWAHPFWLRVTVPQQHVGHQAPAAAALPTELCSA